MLSDLSRRLEQAFSEERARRRWQGCPTRMELLVSRRVGSGRDGCLRRAGIAQLFARWFSPIQLELSIGEALAHR